MAVIQINQYYEYIYKQRLNAREHKDRSCGSCDALFEKIIEIIFNAINRIRTKKNRDFWFLWFNVSRLFLLKNKDFL